MADALREFLQLETAGGVLLTICVVIAMLIANSPLSGIYAALIDMTIAVQVGNLVINKPLLLWVNDGLMAVFFFLIGLEIKREIMDGELSSFDQVILPGMGALGGMVVPSIHIYLAQPGRCRGIGRLGNPGRDRHRLRARPAGVFRRQGPCVPQGFFAYAGDTG